ncbi:hypothetical protein GXW78_17910 [Roseomonas terrae]|jgi:ABC-type transporter Mla subunit MlaD|uniref:Uncharacterized protein n=1 Tax=Neoroseomonas terrae TaxID=424799 RepID=A0ABS5EKJ8_9PROT|nr:hypothetical protein [Neoroseomonas terrae]MBR0651551.1 hypothetical protein [Neoroseomonas terrae]
MAGSSNDVEPVASSCVTAFPHRPEDRLRLALRRLDEAIGEQSAATAALRNAIGDLSHTMSRLGDSVATYRGALDTTAAEVDRALATARRLEGTVARMAP